MILLAFVYGFLGYWAAGRTLYANKVVIYSGPFHYNRALWGFLLGWILIPIAILKLFFGRK